MYVEYVYQICWLQELLRSSKIAESWWQSFKVGFILNSQNFLLDGTDASQMLGELDSAFLFSYAISMFVSGLIAERVNLRYFLSLGMLLSGIFSYMFGMGKILNIHVLWYYLIFQVIKLVWNIIEFTKISHVEHLLIIFFTDISRYCSNIRLAWCCNSYGQLVWKN